MGFVWIDEWPSVRISQLWFYIERAMGTTVEVSDELYRRAKAEAALMIAFQSTRQPIDRLALPVEPSHEFRAGDACVVERPIKLEFRRCQIWQFDERLVVARAPSPLRPAAMHRQFRVALRVVGKP
jgi:hypothetical protein